MTQKPLAIAPLVGLLLVGAFGCGRVERAKNDRQKPVEDVQEAAPSPVEVASLQQDRLPSVEIPPMEGLNEPEANPEAIVEELSQKEAELARREAEVRERESRLAEREAVALPAEEIVEVVTPEPAAEAIYPAPRAAPQSTVREVPVTIPAGTALEAEIATPLSSENSQVGDPVRASIYTTVEIGGRFAIPAGSELLGTVTEAQALKRIGGRAKLGFQFDTLRLPSGATYPIELVYYDEGRSETKRDAATIGGASAAGAILGRILKSDKKTKGGTIGAVVGAAIGARVASRTAGEAIHIPEGSLLNLSLSRALDLTVRVRKIRS